jgi:hypothetical protein
MYGTTLGGGNYGDSNGSGGDGGAAPVVAGDGSGGVPMLLGAGDGSGLQSGKVGGAKAKEKEDNNYNGKSFSVRPSARPTANPWLNNLHANTYKKKRGVTLKKRQAENEEKEREKAAVDLLGGGKKRKKDADISPASAAVEAPILAGHPEVSIYGKNKI